MGKRKTDEAHIWTDAELEKLERRIAAEYKKAADELTDKIDAYFESFKKRDEETKALIGTIVNGKEYTKQDYDQWRLAQIGRGKRFEALRDRIAERMTHANEVAAAYINDNTPSIYSLNRNYSAYTIEQQIGADVGFDLWDEQTVKRLIVDQPDLMPHYPPEKAVERGIDLAWGKRQITAQVTSGILQGESISKIADRLQKEIPIRERNSAIRAARTAVTGAQNAGRQDSYDAAVKMGIEMEKAWIATLDGRTRHDHAMADGQTVAEDKPFRVGGYELMYPGDPRGPGHEIYQCRCTMIAKVKGVDMRDAKRRARDPKTGESVPIENMTYEKWAEWKKNKPNTQAKEKEQGSYQKKAEAALEKMYAARREKFGLKTLSIEEFKSSPLFKEMVSFDGIESPIQNAISEQLEYLSTKYYSGLQSIKVGDKKEFFGVSEFATTKQITTTSSSEIVFNPFKINDTKRIRELSDKGWSAKIKPGDEEKYIITHEFAHSIINVDSVKRKNFVGYDTKAPKKAAKEIESIFERYKEEVQSLQREVKECEFGYIMGDSSAAEKFAEAKKALDATKISDYSLANANEFLAESFTQHEIGVEKNKYAEEVYGILKKYFGR